MYVFKQFLVIYYKYMKNPPTQFALWHHNDAHGIGDILTYVVAYVVKIHEPQSSPKE